MLAQAIWKIGTLKTLLEQAQVIYSKDQPIERELKDLEKVFKEKNTYSKYVIKQKSFLKNTVPKMLFILLWMNKMNQSLQLKRNIASKENKKIRK